MSETKAGPQKIMAAKITSSCKLNHFKHKPFKCGSEVLETDFYHNFLFIITFTRVSGQPMRGSIFELTN